MEAASKGSKVSRPAITARASSSSLPPWNVTAVARTSDDCCASAARDGTMKTAAASAATKRSVGGGGREPHWEQPAVNAMATAREGRRRVRME